MQKKNNEISFMGVEFSGLQRGFQSLKVRQQHKPCNVRNYAILFCREPYLLMQCPRLSLDEGPPQYPSSRNRKGSLSLSNMS